MKQLDIIKYLKSKNFTTIQAEELLNSRFSGLDNKTPNEFAQEKSYEDLFEALKRIYGN
jgi:hypothetical protein